MPKSVFVAAVVRAKQPEGLLLTEPMRTGSIEGVARRLARWFDVSRQAARIRLVELGLVEVAGQRSLQGWPWGEVRRKRCAGWIRTRWGRGLRGGTGHSRRFALLAGEPSVEACKTRHPGLLVCGKA